ncbi:baseplate J/gp47 family protein [Gimesia fumaroli]|uniref:Baseplate J-like protein n=1 Tax=Gimesia fumaroli TaxID=2527976 RepID=A0A518I9W2_9PLAN|nr:hypothetical protein [Gimesia fumaroli]QDV49901.1 hypothetical protein Enr17x_19220 [Gimesia fumaroli]
MSKLSPNLFQRRFQDLMEIGRASLQALAPEWTDHNAHDPGITLMELLAWTAEAQLYSLSRMRHDERQAYAALMGITDTGANSAHGLIWPDPNDINSPVNTFAENVIIPRDAIAHVEGLETTTFQLIDNQLWMPGRLTQLVTHCADGEKIDHTNTNMYGGQPFFPFGERAGCRDKFALSFTCRDKLPGSQSLQATSRHWVIGVQAAPSTQAKDESQTEVPALIRSALQATLVAGQDRIPIKVVSDDTYGMLRTGAIRLEFDNVKISPTTFTIEFHSEVGFARPPRIIRVGANVIPIEQVTRIFRELHVANGLPDWKLELKQPGLRYSMNKEPIAIEIAEPSGVKQWYRCERLSEKGPTDRFFEFDRKSDVATFGNGVNGKIPSAELHVMVTYHVCNGEQGSIARNRKWCVTGFSGVYGVNYSPISGGANALSPTSVRRHARDRVRKSHALITNDDISHAAISLPLLEVSRAWIAPPHRLAPRTGETTLVALRSRLGQSEPDTVPETPRWLEAIRCSLISRIPLGTRLAVIAPRYIDFFFQVELEAQQGIDSESLRMKLVKEFASRLALDDDGVTTPREPGASVTRNDLMNWMRSTAGVKRVLDLSLFKVNGENQKLDQEIRVPSYGLPRWNRRRTTITVIPTAMGGRR